MPNLAIQYEELYGAKNYAPLPVVLVRGKGVYLWDDTGKRYLDMMSAYSAVSHGHCHPQLVKELKKQASRLNIVSRAFYTDKLGLFLKRACEATGFEKALPMNTGAEAIETALKASRKWAYQVKGIPENNAEIIVCVGNFHGRTTTIVSMSTEAQYRQGFSPFTPGFKMIPYGDEKALKVAINGNTAAFLVEPIQGESGIIVPPSGYLKACETICKQYQVLFICDEIQTGLGRTGKLLACDHENVKPDAIVLGKALGGGLIPVSLFLAKAEVMDVFAPGDHGSTFGGNPLAAAVGKVAIDLLFSEHLIEKAQELGNYFQTQLKKIKSPVIKEIRGKGLLIGLQVASPYSARQLCLDLLAAGLLTKDTHGTVIRFAPPLVINKRQIDKAVRIIKKVVSQVSKS